MLLTKVVSGFDVDVLHMLHRRYITAALISSFFFTFTFFFLPFLSYASLTPREQSITNTSFFLPLSLLLTLIKMRIIFHLVSINEYLAFSGEGAVRRNMKYKMERKKFHFDRARAR